jgi:hypothetical protein
MALPSGVARRQVEASASAVWIEPDEKQRVGRETLALASGVNPQAHRRMGRPDLDDRNVARLSHKPCPASSFCASVTRTRFLTESFRSRRSRFGRLNGSHEVDPNGGCQIRTTTLVCATASRKTGNSHATCRGAIRLLHPPDPAAQRKPRFRLVTSIFCRRASSALLGAESTPQRPARFARFWLVLGPDMLEFR